MRFIVPLAISFAVSMTVPAAMAQTLGQQVEHGKFVQHGWLNTRKEIEPLDIRNTGAGDQMKGAHRVAITVFNVAFPDAFKLEAKSHGSVAFALVTLSQTRKSTMQTRIAGIDLATRQRIADAAYADLVAQLKAAGFEVVDAAGLAAAAPEFAAWDALPNGSPGRFGTYVAPTGMKLRFMPGDTAKRASNGMFSSQMLAFRTLDTTQGYTRSPYVARDANVTALAVTMVVDYGVYSTTGNRKGYGRKVSTGFEEGATVAAGSVMDSATVVRVWNTHSGGFPTQITLQQPVISDADIGPAVGADGDYTVQADPATFVPAALDVTQRVNAAIVGTMLAHN